MTWASCCYCFQLWAHFQRIFNAFGDVWGKLNDTQVPAADDFKDVWMHSEKD